MSNENVNYITIETPKGPVTILKSQIVGYARKSTKGDRAACSISEQVVGIRRFLRLRHGVDLPDEQILEEAPGLGGDLYWEGGGSGWNRTKRTKRTRPKMSNLVAGVEAERVKLIVVWDFSRLWRHTGVCADLLELFAEKGVLLANRDGLVDITTADGRRRLKDQASAFQDVRDGISDNTNRAFDAKRERGEAVKIGRYLGYGRKEKRVVEVFPLEIDLVRRMYTMFVFGERGEPRMSPLAIATRLTDEGLGRLFPEAAWDKNRTNVERFVYEKTVRLILQSPRYIGMQWRVDPDPRALIKRQMFRADEFLIDKKWPAVDPDVWYEAQRILERNARGPRRAVAGRAGSGMLRCGVCGKLFVLTKGPKRAAKGESSTAADGLSAWRVRSNRSFHCCDHMPPAIPRESLLRFFRTDLAKVLKAELRRSHSRSEAADLDNKIADLRLKRSTLEQYLRKTAVESIENLMNGKTMLSKGLAEEAEAKILEINSHILEAEDAKEESARAVATLNGFDSDDEDKLREAIRSAIVWGAVVPVTARRPRFKVAKVGEPKVVGHVLFLTAWRTYHTAVIEECVVKGRTTRARATNVLRLLPPEEGLGTVANLPSSKKFVGNLKREQGKLRTRGVFKLENWAPSCEATETHQQLEDEVNSILCSSHPEGR